VGDPVSFLLDKQDLACEFGAFGPPFEHLLEQLRRPERVPTGLREQVEESAVFGDEGERQGAKLPRKGLITRERVTSAANQHEALRRVGDPYGDNKPMRYEAQADSSLGVGRRS